MEIFLTLHAARKAFADHISTSDMIAVLSKGEVIEVYPDDYPLPSGLVLGWVKFSPLHVVTAHRPRTDEEVIITVYEPDPRKWSKDFRRRLP